MTTTITIIASNIITLRVSHKQLLELIKILNFLICIANTNQTRRSVMRVKREVVNYFPNRLTSIFTSSESRAKIDGRVSLCFFFNAGGIKHQKNQDAIAILFTLFRLFYEF